MEEKLKTIVVPHTHWDREWYLTFEGFRFHLVEALDRVLNLLERSPDYRFTLDGQVLPLLDYLEIHPEMEGKLRDFIREGRLLVGPWYVQPDEFLVSGESLIRNLLYGTRIAQAFGGTMLEGYVPDSFGHIAQLPQIFTDFGIGSAFVMRGADRACEEAGGPDFLWRAPDGSAVLCHVMEMGYCNAEQLSADPAELTRSLERLVEAGLLDPEGEPFVTFLTELQRRSRTGAILLLNGCDHRGPQMDLPEVVEGLNRRFPEFRFTIGTLSDYAAALRRVKESLPVIEGEFRTPVRHPILTGVLSARMYLKQANHRVETLLTRYAELLVALTRVLAKVDLKPFLDHSWKLLLQNHAHDSICGTGVDPIHREMEVRFARAEALATEVAREALRSLVMAQGKGKGLSVFVFNPCPWGRREEITAEIPAQAAGVVLRGPRGEKVPTAVVGEKLVSEGILSGVSHQRKAVISFQAELPPLGIAAFRLDPDERAEEVGARRGSLVVDDRTLENEFYRVTVYENGTFDLLDKATGRLFRGLNLLEDSGDAGDEYNYSPPPKQRVLSSADIRGTVGVAADLPWRGTLEVSLVFPLPVSLDPERVARSEETVEVPVRFRISLQRGLKRVDIEAEVDNRARDHRLRVAFPTGIPAEKSIAEGTFWVNERPTRPPEAVGWVEDPPVTHPQKAFVAVEDGKGGFVVFNRGLPEYEVAPEGTIYLTLLRCVGWLSRGDLSTRRGHAGPPYETPEAQCPGKHTFRYAVYTYQGCWEEAGVLRMAQAFIAPPIAISWERTESIGERTFLFLDPDAVLLSAVKPPEEGEGIVIRIYNPTARYLEAVLRVGFPLSGARELRLDESPLRDLPIRGDILRLPLKGGEIKTIHLIP
ncbi:MAG TPA: hypothetical protein ENF77_04105 [Candidatus Acetothermia bacterium]|nr:hypothetical protein [Candidatus Acetothermia bacterium]